MTSAGPERKRASNPNHNAIGTRHASVETAPFGRVDRAHHPSCQNDLNLVGVVRRAGRTRRFGSTPVTPTVYEITRRNRLKTLAVSAAILTSTLAFAVGPALAAGPTVFRNIAATLPGNVPSEAFEATSTSEFGDLIQLGAGERASGNLPVTVVMSSWACESGGNATCQTTPGATWSQPLTLSLYAVDSSGTVPVAVKPALLQTTQTLAIPYRPSRDSTGHCQASGFYPWYSTAENACYSGLAHPVTFTLPAGITLPDQLIWSIAFNTENHGYAPLGKSGPWNSLNVGAQTFAGQPSVGTDVDPMSAFLNSSGGQSYNDGGAAGTGTFRDDVGNTKDNWSANAPLACFGACPIDLAASPTPVATATPSATPSAIPSATPSAAATPSEQVEAATATPSEQVASATGTPRLATPPPTNSGSPSEGGSSGLLMLLIAVGIGSVGVFAVAAQRRRLGR